MHCGPALPHSGSHAMLDRSIAEREGACREPFSQPVQVRVPLEHLLGDDLVQRGLRLAVGILDILLAQER